jgi:hypothetical protein
MSHLIIEQIQRRARLDHCGDFSKAATQYFREHPGWRQSIKHKDELAGVDKRNSEERDEVNATVQLRMDMVACRDKLDFSTNRPIASRRRRKCSLRIPNFINATALSLPCVLARFR